MKNKFFLSSFFIIFAFFLLPVFSYASFFQSSDISLSTNPSSPGPNTSVVATLSSFGTDMNRATISWYLNGQFVSGGFGKISYSFKTGTVGSPTKLSASIITSEGATVEKVLNITPGEVDVLWQAQDSYTPPFYRGKALPSTEGVVRVVAVPNLKSSSGVFLKPNELVYSWEKNLKPDASASGFGKNYFDVYSSYLDQSQKISVSASSVSNHTGGLGDAEISLSSPKIVFYKKDPLSGINYAQAIGKSGLLVDEKEVVVVAEPYFVNPKNLNSSRLEYNWYSGTTNFPTPTKKNELLMTFPNSKSGQSTNISLNLTNTTKLFGSTLGTFKVTLK